MKTLPINFPDKNICILGMGYVGLTLAVAMARVGFNIHGLEVRNDVLELLKKGKSHFWEPSLDNYLKKAVKGGNFTSSIDLKLSDNVSVYIITVGTPLNKNGSINLDMISNATRQIANHLKDNSLIILRSTVRIGTAREVISPILESTGRKFEIAVCPERTLEGKALSELQSLPQIIGADTQDTLFRASQIFSFLTSTIVRVSSLESAEVIKLIDNTYRDVIFGFANEVARVCDAVGVDAQEVIQSGKLGYERTSVAHPGPVGGPCLEKDPHILTESAKLYGINLDITPASRLVNERQPSEVVNFIKDTYDKNYNFTGNPVICLLGIAFKGSPETNDLRGTMARPILDLIKISFQGSIVKGFDPIVSQYDIEKFGLMPVETIDEAFSGSDIVLILNNHMIFDNMILDKKSTLMSDNGFIYDLWSLFNKEDLKLSKKVSYYSLGSQKI